MGAKETSEGRRRYRWLPWSGVAAVVGVVVAIGTPWAQAAVFGTRPYVASGFDMGSLIGWILLLVGLGGVYVAFRERFGRLGRAAVGVTAAGMLIIAGLLCRRVALFIEAGFRAIPATGEDPAGLVLSMATLLGLGYTVLGTGGLGLALRRIDDCPAVTVWLLLLAPVVSLGVIVSDLGFGLPVALGRLLVSTNVILIPFGLGWLALGATVYRRTGSVSNQYLV